MKTKTSRESTITVGMMLIAFQRIISCTENYEAPSLDFLPTLNVPHVMLPKRVRQRCEPDSHTQALIYRRRGRARALSMRGLSAQPAGERRGRAKGCGRP